MPLSKSGSYHANPATAAMHDKAAAPAELPDPGAQPEAQAVEIHSPNHPETGDGVNHHLRIHHADGSMEESKHPSFQEASDAAGAAMGNEAEPSDDAGEEAGEDQGSEGSDADDEY
jgi:hypothetical protein